MFTAQQQILILSQILILKNPFPFVEPITEITKVKKRGLDAKMRSCLWPCKQIPKLIPNFLRTF